jgi:3-deoxy-D-manno-octulosonic-acid transferase
LLLLNGRLSQRSFQGWERLPGLIRPLLACFELCLAQDDIQADRLRRLGAAAATSVGDLKTAAAPLPCDEGELSRIGANAADRPLWLAASTHAGEEEAAADVHRGLKHERPGLLTIIAPRHPARAPEIATMLAQRGLNVARRSAGDALDAKTDIYLADTLGELGLFYRLAGIAFIGGSLTPVGGHNPLEAAMLDCAILQGPDTSKCAAIAKSLADAGATIMIRDAAELTVAVRRLLADPVERAARAAAAAGVVTDNQAVLDAVLKRIAPWLDRLTAHAANP